MDKLAAMKTFVRVVEAGSFSAVAKDANSSQSAVSKQIAALERELGASLLTRTTRSLALTDDGERYFEQARRILAELAEAESTLRFGEGHLSGWIRVAASVGFGRLKLLPLIEQFLRRHPLVKIDLRLHDGFIDLVEQGIDLSVRIGSLPDSTLIARLAGNSHRVLLASRDYLRHLVPPLSAPRHPDDLARHVCVVYTGIAAANTWSFVARSSASDPAGSLRSVQVGGRIQTNSSEVIRSAVLSGMGIGFAPSWLFEAEIRDGTAVRLMPDWESPPTPIHLVSPPQRQNSLKVRAFADFLVQALRSA